MGTKASFGEMLLLIAIHFHSNQNNAIADLVSSTLGIKVMGWNIFFLIFRYGTMIVYLFISNSYSVLLFVYDGIAKIVLYV